ncbi:MAG: sulfatase-like hydrolase/transferase [Chloroflexota bacterium]|nr:sulfatase-like hydrolase/transferase [Chloroflexota bacterium]MDE2948037.1 sulfatase-like hydrolase/transferase [Chloroflexota bacterium]
MSRPNFLFLIADDHRHSALGALGTEAVSTPTFDQLIADGACFTQAHIMGSTSGAVCMPSRGMLMSGCGLFHTPDPLPDDVPLLPELLRQSGYRTFGAGKWHNRRGSYARCFGESGAVFFGGMNDQYAMPVNDFDPAGAYPPAETYIADGFATTVFSDEMIDFLNQRGPDDAEPFFAYIAFTSPHDPRTPPPPYDAMYDPADIELPPNFMPEHPFEIGVRDIRDEVLAGYPRGEDEIKRHIADYYGMISHMDHDIGRILETLEARGLRENTVVIYTSDHGLGVGQHGLMGKQNLYDHSMRIPLIMRGPGVPAGLRSRALLYLLDLYPTLLEMAGVAVPEHTAGHSLAALLNEVTYMHRRQIFSAYQGVFGHPAGTPYQRSIKNERKKLIQTVVDGEETWQLFDLRNDPYEINNLIAEAASAALVERLKEDLKKRGARADDPVLQGNL